MAWEVDLHTDFVPEFHALRFTFAFDPERNGIVLCGGDKSGGSEKRFYRQLIAKADERFDAHLAIVSQRGTTRGAPRKGKRRS